MNKKSNLGQFFTTNYEYILQGLEIPETEKNIIEPFAGNCDLLKFINDTDKYIIEIYDIDPKTENTVKRDTLSNPPDFNDKFILTNPPYLARNKSNDKNLFDKYNTNDLYKCFIRILTNSNPSGGIIIIPLNFWCSVRKSDIDLRRDFLNKFDILRLNIFEERVFDDTSYTVCSFIFTKKVKNKIEILTWFFPSKKNNVFEFSKTNNYTIGGEIYNLQINKNYKINRLLDKDDKNKTNIVVKCLDDNESSKISMKIVNDEDLVYDKTLDKSARSYATLTINPPISKQKQTELVSKFNDFLEKYREK
jgi:hypothetical protein